MAGTSVEPQQDEYTVQAFPLCLATEEMMIEAKLADTSRDFQNAVADLPVSSLPVSLPALDFSCFFAVLNPFPCSILSLFAGVSHFFYRAPQQFGDPLAEKITGESWNLSRKTLCKA